MNQKRKCDKRHIETIPNDLNLNSYILHRAFAYPLWIGVTKRTIERAFISLQNKKVIERIGSKRDGSWIVIK